MIFIKPWFYDDFRCVSSRCTDNCCIGWEIDVDDEALKKYGSITGEFGQRLKNNLQKSSDGSICFRLCRGERCAFLNNDNLCDIIINCGEAALCDICREHPRFYEWFPGVTECGLGLCCEEVCRLIVEAEQDFQLVEHNDGEKISVEHKEDIVLSDRYIFISAFREALFDILSSDSLSLEEKLVKILSKTESITGEKITLNSDEKLIDLYLKTEPIDEVWTEYINTLAEQLSDVKGFSDNSFSHQSDKVYSSLLSYILYRHMIKSVFDNCIAARICFCVESLRFIMLCDGKTILEKGELTVADRIENMKRWSKQIEYSEENTELLIFGDEIYG